MPRFNMLRVLQALHLDTKYHANAYRFLFTLEDPSSRFYNPHAASVIRRIFYLISHNATATDKRLTDLVTLFMGQVESLLISTSSYLDESGCQNIADAVIFNQLAPLKPMTKANFQEKIDSLLYAKKERKIYAMENYYPTVSFTDSSASLMVHTSIMSYLKSTQDKVFRERKLSYLRKRSEDPAVNMTDRLICRMLAQSLSRHIDDEQSEGGDSFGRLFRKIAAESGIGQTRLIDKCIGVRNNAVHEGKCKWDFAVLGIYFILLLSSKMAFDASLELDGGRKIEQSVKIEMEKDIRRKRINKICLYVVGISIWCVLIYIALSFIVGSYIGKTDMQRVRWDSTDSQFNARMNEIIATKDTAQLLQVQKDLKWMQETLNESSNNNR